MLMVKTEIMILLGVIGACFGSFIDALTWRIHTKRNFVSERSECEHCHHVLGPLDLIPIVSWVVLGGKCRYCGAKIGVRVVITEVTLAALFVVSFAFWPLGFATWQATTLFGVWLAYLVALGALLVYDMRWMLLPNAITLPLIGVGLVDAALRISLQHGSGIIDYISYVVLGAAALGGVYWVLYAVSKGKWVGFGDVKLGVFIGVVLGWQGALLALALANMFGFIIVLPGLLSKKLTPKSRVPFGPFLIAAFVVVGLFGNSLIHWYLTFVGL